MSSYEVTLTQTITRKATIIVEADSPEEAEGKALAADDERPKNRSRPSMTGLYWYPDSDDRPVTVECKEIKS